MPRFGKQSQFPSVRRARWNRNPPPHAGHTRWLRDPVFGLGSENLLSATYDLRAATVRECAGEALTPLCRYAIETIGHLDTWQARDGTCIWTEGAVQLCDVEERFPSALIDVWEGPPWGRFAFGDPAPRTLRDGCPMPAGGRLYVRPPGPPQARRAAVRPLLRVG